MIKVVGLITARGGSKGIPQKNVRPLAGKPLIAWTIEAALRSRLLERVIVSTDDEEIARTAREWGADVPFMRPVELAQDDSPHLAVIRHALGWLGSEQKTEFDYLLLLQPTSPLRSTEDIDKSIALAEEKDADAVVSVCLTHDHPFLSKQVTADGRLLDFVEKPPGYLARQRLPPAYSLNGAIYLVRRSVLLERDDWYTDSTFAYIMPPERSLDIDTPWDLHLVDLILRDTNGSTND
jgi:CMP-N-acetylneuraminic acid synthetase